MMSLFREHPYYPLSLCIILILFAWAGRIDASNPGALPVYDCTTQSEIPEVECDALVALYNSTMGDSWIDNTDWLITTTPCSWYGISCIGNHVTNISMGNNQLDGSLPAELGNLTNLQGLTLYDNQLEGAIPAELGNLANLDVLWLQENQLSGVIPPELGNLTNLQGLILRSNQLDSEIPSELGNLANLEDLWLGSNQLSGVIPPELGNLSNLGSLSLYSNQLGGTIPPELGDLTNLQGLTLYDNQLSGAIPPELGDLVNLENLFLQHNELDGAIPPELGSLTNLQELNLTFTQLSDAVPISFSNLTSLSYFFFYNTNLCEPSNIVFQAWLGGVANVGSTGVACAVNPTITIVNDMLELNWTDAAEYNIYRALNEPYLMPINPPYAASVNGNSWTDSDPNAVGDASQNYFYMVCSVNGCGYTDTWQRVGVFNFDIEPGL